jgi:hypothetical protein
VHTSAAVDRAVPSARRSLAKEDGEGGLLDAK